MMDRNILLVDDNRDILKLLRNTLDTLKEIGIEDFRGTFSGEEAMLKSSRRKIDLLITDLSFARHERCGAYAQGACPQPRSESNSYTRHVGKKDSRADDRSGGAGYIS